MIVCLCVCVREGERDRQTDRETDRQTDSKRERDRDRQLMYKINERKRIGNIIMNYHNESKLYTI